MVYSFADFKIEYDNMYDMFASQCADYISEEEPDFKIELTEQDINSERELADGEFSNSYLETIAFYRKLADILPSKNAFVLHSAFFEVEGEGIAFAAHSGTGKTTHMRLWKKLLGDKMKVVNGDKPIIRFFDEDPKTPYGYGTPWNGKERMGTNSKAPLKHICFIERATDNSCEPMAVADVVDLIFNQVYMPKNPLGAVATIQLINRLVNSCNLWKIKCNMDIEAAATAYNTIFKKQEKLL